jgi:hypothetical protein
MAGDTGSSSGGAADGGAAGSGNSSGTGGTIPLNTRVIHRYSFDGSGTEATDSIGAAHGTIQGGATLDGDGKVTLAGGTSDQFVDLPNGLISALEETTIEAWIEWNGDGGWFWQRVFDFGNSNAGEGQQGSTGTTHFSLALESNFTRLDFDADPAAGQATWRETYGGGMGAGAHHIVATFSSEPGNQMIACYVDGTPIGDPTSVPDGESLSDLDDVNNWLGRAQWDVDDDFDGTFHEFRIYDIALTEAQVAESGAAGPDTLVF